MSTSSAFAKAFSPFMSR